MANIVYLSNAFSLQMQGKNECSTRRVTLDEAKQAILSLVPGPYIDRESEKDGSDAVVALTAKSCVGHADIAAMLSRLIGVDVPVNRVSVSLQPGDTLIVGQYIGPRLPEGATALPEGAKIEWYRVSCRKAGYIAELLRVQNDFADAAANCQWPAGEKMLLDAAKKHFPSYFGEEE